jgi:hypothetical protein
MKFEEEGRVISVGKVTGYRLDGRGIGVLFPAGARNISVLHSAQTGSRVKPASYTMDIRIPFPESKGAGA